MNLTNKTVFITGANRGIGRATVKALLDADVKKVYAAARNLDSLPDFGDPRVVPVAVDITKPATIAFAAADAGDVNLLINNAGAAHFGSLLDMPRDAIRADVDVNYYGTLDMVREFLPVLEKNALGKDDAAAIVNVVTIAAFVNFPGIGGYSASKAALFSMSQGLRIELAPRGVSVHTVNPGPIDTDMAKDLDMDKTSPEEAARRIVAGLRDGQADIFPDAGSEQMFGLWQGNYRDLERAVYDMHHAA
ncbi:MAG: SDR family oxidoreductase [Pseudomonadota bacterium]